MSILLKGLIVSLPFTFIWSIFLLEANLVFLTFFSLYNFIKEKNFSYFNNVIFKIVLVFSIYLIISRIFFHELDIGKNYSFFYLRYIIYVLCLSYVIKIIKYDKSFLFLFIIASLILSIDAYIQFFTGYNLFGNEIENTSRISSFFDEELILGSFICKISPLLISFFFIDEIKNKKLLYFFLIALIIINLFTIILSGERSALFLYFLFCTYLFIFLKVKLKIKFYFLFILITFLISFLLINKNFYNRMIDQTFYEIFGKSTKNITYYDLDGIFVENYHKKNCKHQKIKSEECKSNVKIFFFSPTHHNYILTSLRIFKDYKFFGSGPKSFRELCKIDKYSINIYSCATHPHNYYIQVLSETGIFGLLFLLFFYFYFVFKLFNILNSNQINNNQKNFFIILLGGMLINFFPLVPTGNFFNNWLSILSYFPIIYLINDRIFKS